MPYELACGTLTAMEGFRLHIPSYTSFLTSNTQDVAHHAQSQGSRINTWCQRFQVHCVFIFIEVGEWVTPGSSPGEKRRAKSRLMTSARLVKNSVDLPT
jgi:hypothetical protein